MRFSLVGIVAVTCSKVEPFGEVEIVTVASFCPCPFTTAGIQVVGLARSVAYSIMYPIADASFNRSNSKLIADGPLTEGVALGRVGLPARVGLPPRKNSMSFLIPSLSGSAVGA